ncbi:transglycosylase SLT domain-containing protein [Pontibacterium granulatum]|uniref:transglycosylase SLT domain-containing protein n=1 Tax=Pontibacterium granulatum TaxID=2036029 RepID=UPI00249C00DE|nr:transglycosylase SLT domain-containing protein [Pontibacterium granulatum]MDI3324968.1 transglycosylase SLT domain-containing protein [Pontibacterium granulatum]
MRRFALCLALAITAPFSQATTLDQQRVQFKTSYELVKRGELTALQKAPDALQEYALYPYLEFELTKKNLSNTNQAQVNSFINRYADTPLPWQLNRAWLSYLFKNKRWEDYRTAYKHHPVQNDLYSCRLQVARLNSGAEKQALTAAESLWLVPHSQHDACDPLFAAWKKIGKPTSSLALKRFWLATEKGNIRLARFIERSITNKAHKAQTAVFWKISKDPSQIEKLSKKLITGNARAIALTYAYKRWSLKDRVAATTSWLKQREKLSKAEQSYRRGLDRTLGLRLATNYDAKATALIAKLDPDYQIKDLTEWRIRVALSNQDWKDVSHTISKLPPEEQKNDRWMYWKAIAESQLDKSVPANKKLAAVSQERSFYGFLAAELNNQPFALNKQSIPLQKPVMGKLESIPGLIRARELHQMNMITDANREWRRVEKSLSKDQKLMAGYLALSWGWHNRAINAAISTHQWDELSIRFPSPHKQLFEKNARLRKIDLTWPLAIARQESAFLKNAKSHAGARGLMQLMPTTAKRTARKHKIPYKRLSQLTQPQTNIALGTAYLGEMYNLFDNNKAYATAAYNAGPHRVKKWLDDRGHLPLDIWIETIPFKETRRYVQNVLAFRVIYDRMSGHSGNLLSDQEEKLLALNAKTGDSNAL